jgi:HD-like signal output (HDOD) protein
MNIIQRLNGINNLPTLPEIALRVQQLVFSDDGDAARLARIIQQDPALTAKILSMANSGFYGASSRISSVPMAITRVGFNEIGQIIMATSIIKNLSKESNRLDYRQFWKHALTAAHMAHFTTRASAAGFSEEGRASLYLAGLLHDIGILVYDQFFSEEFDEILKYAAAKEASFLEAEREVAPKDTHAAVGAALLEIWKLSPSAIGGVRFHHAPERSPDKEKIIPFAIYLSEYILCNSGIGSFEGPVAPPGGSIIANLNIKPEDLPSYLREAQNEVEKSELVVAMGKPELSHSGQGPRLLRTV